MDLIISWATSLDKSQARWRDSGYYPTPSLSFPPSASRSLLDMHFLSSSLLLIALSTAGAQARPHEVSLRNFSPVAKALSLSRSPKVEVPAVFKRQTVSSDGNTLSAMASCVTTTTDPTAQSICICQEMAALSPTCESCILNYDEITPTEWAQTCSDLSTGGTGTAATTAAGSTTTGTSSGTTCASQCSSASDTMGLQTLNTCSSTDTTCLCEAAEALSSTCLDCALAAAGIGATEFEQACAASASGTAATSAAIPANTAGSGGSGAGTTSGGASPAHSPSASTTGTAKSAAGKVTVGGHGVALAGAFVVVGGLIALL
ncbi:hypothetical protein CALVIDRAFT_575428 [Calocera viscosa TUFC12733]|uniref:Uncharacterized protein n=1 Tax=Calocera viscosa (strain TUFC12733) TaxID=1330018 RepID=A0A167MFD0_CALVF|nr:hypothetical protein CALVIDRAFT_575428 [Calocera viscosa TUFC12733]